MNRSSLADAPQPGEDPDARGRPRQTAHKQDRAEFHVERAAPEMGDGARDRRGDDLVGAGGDRHDGRNVVEDQQRRDQEAAAHPEHAGEEAHGRAHAQNDEDVHRQLCDRQVDSHGRTSTWQKRRPRGRCAMWLSARRGYGNVISHAM